MGAAEVSPSTGNILHRGAARNGPSGPSVWRICRRLPPASIGFRVSSSKHLQSSEIFLVSRCNMRHDESFRADRRRLACTPPPVARLAQRPRKARIFRCRIEPCVLRLGIWEGGQPGIELRAVERCRALDLSRTLRCRKKTLDHYYHQLEDRCGSCLRG